MGIEQLFVLGGIIPLSLATGFGLSWWILRADSRAQIIVLEEEVLRLRRRLSAALEDAKRSNRERDHVRSRWRKEHFGRWVAEREEPTLKGLGAPKKRNASIRPAGVTDVRNAQAPDAEDAKSARQVAELPMSADDGDTAQSSEKDGDETTEAVLQRLRTSIPGERKIG